MHECPCCGDDYIYSDDLSELCKDCKEAGCEPHDCEASCGYSGKHDVDGVYDDCQVRACFSCPECDTPMSFMNDGRWHDNCEAEDCERKRTEGSVSHA